MRNPYISLANVNFCLLCFCLGLILVFTAEYSCDSPDSIKNPYVDGSKIFVGGKISSYGGKIETVYSPIIDSSTKEKFIIGKLSQMTSEDSVMALEHAKQAWSSGQGIWPQMTMDTRIWHIEQIILKLKEKRSEIVEILQWEIGKSIKDAESEFDRTISFMKASIEEAINFQSQSKIWKTVSGIYAKVKRAAIGIMLCLGPFNYPFNETYATMIPALLMGNVVILKLPTIGGLAHILTMEIYSSILPPGVINFVSGSGRITIPPVRFIFQILI